MKEFYILGLVILFLPIVVLAVCADILVGLFIQILQAPLKIVFGTSKLIEDVLEKDKKKETAR